ncbi:MAG: hypothetical protein LBB67_05260 [Oscillospiraceae bacterium]|jgi:DNA-directed RNA polymerase specialized sigma24 family protein|nr:hypothetical protein [Oscillospiraceae bacterium]
MAATLSSVLEALRTENENPAAMDAVFAQTHKAVYFFCKTVFANAESILRVMQAFYLTLQAEMTARTAPVPENDARQMLDLILYSVCKQEMKERDRDCFVLRGDLSVYANRYNAIAKKEHITAQIPLQENDLHTWLAMLSPEQRLLFVMRDMRNLPLQEIARMLRVSENMIAAQLWMCSEAARQALEKKVAADQLPPSPHASSVFLPVIKKSAEKTVLSGEKRKQLLVSIHEAHLARKEVAPRALLADDADDDALTPDSSEVVSRFEPLMLLRSIGIIGAAVALAAFAVFFTFGIEHLDGANKATAASFSFQNPSNSNEYPVIVKTTTSTTVEIPWWVTDPALYSVQTQTPVTVASTTQTVQATKPRPPQTDATQSQSQSQSQPQTQPQTSTVTQTTADQTDESEQTDSEDVDASTEPIN